MIISIKLNSPNISNNCYAPNFRAKIPQNGTQFSQNFESLQNEVLDIINSHTGGYNMTKYIDYIKLKSAGIPNLKLVYNKGVRGESLSASGNSRFLPLIKECGIDTVIDLRTADYTPKYKAKCERHNLKYVHIPIDKKNVPDREIIENMPLLFQLIDRGKFYMACAQGLHRTDIALAINYVFNPKQKIPPFMAGHTKFHITEMDDINRRLNSLYRALTPDDKTKLGWTEEYEKEFTRKKRILKTYSETYKNPKIIY